MNSIRLKAGDKVKSLVDFFGIRKGDIVTVTYVGIGYINVAEDNGSTLTDDEFEVFIQEEPSQMTIESLLKLAKEYAEKAAESQRKSEELYEKADKMYNKLRGNTEEQAVEEDMSDPSNWRVGDIVKCLEDNAGCYPSLSKGQHLYLSSYYPERDSTGSWDVDTLEGGFPRGLFFDIEELCQLKWVSRPSKETK